MRPEEFELMLSRLMDRDLSEKEFEEFERHLMSSPEAQERYLDHVDVENLLSQKFAPKELVKPGVSKVFDVSAVLQKQVRKTLRISAFAAAAVVMVSMVSLHLFFAADQAPLLAFETAPGTEFKLTHSKTHRETEGMILEKGSRLELSHGTVELTFGSGVKSIVTAPADFSLVDDDLLSLRKGTAWFHVPQEAVGFKVITPELNIVDLGTEFGVLADGKEFDEVHVFKGKVKVTSMRAKRESAELSKGDARRIDLIGRLGEIPIQSSLFVTALPRESPTVVFEDQFNEALPEWISTGMTRYGSGNYLNGDSMINTVAESDHSGIHFDRMGREVPAVGDGFYAIGSSMSPPRNSVSAAIPVIHGKRYTVYFRYAGSHNESQRITATVSLDNDTVSTGSLHAPDQEWESHSFVFTPRTSGNAILTFDDSGTFGDRDSDLLLDSVVVTSIPIFSPRRTDK